MRIGTVILTYNSAAWVEKALTSVFKSGGDFEHRVVVADNCSQDNTREVLRRLQANFDFEIIFSDRNRGFSGGVNLGLKVLGFQAEIAKRKVQSAKPEAVLLLNPDAQLTPDALAALASRLRGDVGIAAPRLVYPNGAPQASNFGRFPTWRTQLAKFFKLHKFLPWGHYIHPRTAPSDFFKREHSVGWVSGGAMLIKSAVLERVGLFDENFFLYVEDIDFCRRARLAGFDIKFVPDALAYHKLGASFSRSTKQEVRSKGERFPYFVLRTSYFSPRAKLPRDFERESLQYYFRKYRGGLHDYYAATDLHREPAGLRRLDFMVEQVRQRFGEITGLRVLDVGAGLGNVSRAFSFLGASVTAVENDSATAAALRLKTAGLAIKVVEQDIRAFRPRERFDVIILSEVLEHFANPGAVLKHCVSLLKKNGLLVVSVPNGRGLEERVRRWGLKSKLGQCFKARIQTKFAKAGMVQTEAASPHQVFLSYAGWQRLFSQQRLQIIAAASQSAGFKTFYYLFGRLFLKRDSAWFRRLDRWDAALARRWPANIGDGFMFMLVRGKMSAYGKAPAASTKTT